MRRTTSGGCFKHFPGVFTGIGEFTIYKEFVSVKIAGEVASLEDPALDRIIEFAAEVGLVVLIHNHLDVPFPKEGAEPAYLEQAAHIEAMLRDREYRHVNFDIS